MRRHPQGGLNDGAHVIVAMEFRDFILSLTQESLFAGHLGRTTMTYRVINSDYFLPGMYCGHICQVAG